MRKDVLGQGRNTLKRVLMLGAMAILLVFVSLALLLGVGKPREASAAEGDTPEIALGYTFTITYGSGIYTAISDTQTITNDASLQTLLTGITAFGVSTGKAVSINFNNVMTDALVTLSGSTPYVLTGSIEFTHAAVEGDNYITLDGAEVHSFADISTVTDIGTANLIFMDNNATLFIKGGTVSAQAGRAVYNASTGVVTVGGGSTLATVTSKHTADRGTIALFDGIEGEDVLVVKENALITNAYPTNVPVAIYNVVAGTVAIEGGTVSALAGSGIYNKGTGEVRITNGTVSGKSYGIENRSTGALNITGGTVSSEKGGATIYNNSTGKISVSQANPEIPTVINATDSEGRVIFLINRDGDNAVLTLYGDYLYIADETSGSGKFIVNSAGAVVALASDYAKPEDVSKVYDGSAAEISYSGGTGFSDVTWTWSRKNETDGFDIVDGEVESTLSRTNVTDTGIYRASVVINAYGHTATYTLEEISVNITKAAGSGSVTMAGWTYKGTSSNPAPTSATNGTASVTYLYTGRNGTTYNSASRPENAGDYTVTATFAATDNYTACTASADFTIAKANGSGSVTMSGWTYKGTASNPAPTSATNGTSSVTYLYTGRNGTTYSSASRPENAGDYTVTATFTATDNYTACTASANFTITKAAGSGSVTMAGWTYKGTSSNPAPTSATNGTGSVTYLYTGRNDTTYSSASRPENAGDYTVTATFAATDNYATCTASANFTIVAKALTNELQDITGEFTYNGSAHTPAVTVTGLTLNTDYTVAYKDNTNAGTATVTITGKGNYSGTLSKTFAIAKANGSGSVSMVSWPYDGNVNPMERDPVPTSATNGIGSVTYMYTGRNDTTYNSAEGPINAGDYTVTATFAATDNYEACTATADFAILKASGLLSVAISGWTYGGAPSSPGIYSSTHNYSDVTIEYKPKDAADSSYTGTVPRSAGQYTVRASFAATANYRACTATADFTIAVRTLTDELQDITGTFTYNGSAHTPTVTVTGLTLTTDYTVAYTDNTNAGTATVTITGTGSCSGTLSKTFTIAVRTLTEELQDVTGTFTYNGSAHTPTVTVTGLTLNTDYTVAYKDNTNAGTATVTVTGKGNYSGTLSKTFVIAKAAGSGSVTMAGWTYKGTASNPAPTSATNGTGSVTYLYTGRNGTTYNSASRPENAGDYTVTATFAATDNYAACTASANFTIAAKALTNELQDITGTFSYNGSAHAPTVTVTGLTLNTDYTVAYKDNTNAGTATVTITGKGNYSGTLSKTFAIAAKTLTNELQDITGTFTYSGSAHTPTVTVTGLTLNTDYTVAYKDNTNAGTATVTITGKGNYSGTLSKTFAVAKANGSGSVTMAGWKKGKTASTPTLSGIPESYGTPVYEYKLKGADDSTYSTSVPTKKGEYTLRVTFAETANYNAYTTVADFKITAKGGCNSTAASSGAALAVFMILAAGLVCIKRKRTQA